MRTMIATTGVLLIATASLSYAQDGRPRQRWPGADRGGQTQPSGSDSGTGEQAPGGGDSARRAEPRGRQGGETARPEGLPQRRGADLANGQRERDRAAEPRLRRPEGAPRFAVPRPTPPPRVAPGRNAPLPRLYDSRPYSRRYGWYVGRGPSYFVYADPYYRYRYQDRSFLWYGDVGGYGFGYPTGELRLNVRPWHAEVYVDGYYAGIVDDFDGFGQGLRLEDGPYHIEIVAGGYEPAEFDVRIQAGRRISFERDLLPER